MLVYHPMKKDERGFVLIAALVFMIVMTLVALSVANSTTAEEKMARNFRDQDLAFSAAEATLRDAKNALRGAYIWPYSPAKLLNFTSACTTNGLCDSYNYTPAAPIASVDFYGAVAPGTQAVSYGAITGEPSLTGGLIAQPRYLIELVPTQKLDEGGSAVLAFRITVQAKGRFPNTRVTLQELYLPAPKIN
jgi:type IV pilus assembly protein PilX